MIREATHGDIPRLNEMGEAFWSKSPWAAVGPYCPEKAAHGFATYIDGDMFGVFVIEADGHVCGAICVLAADLWTVSGGVLAQELFWWVEPAGAAEAHALWVRGEDWAREQGAPVLAMIRLEGLRDAAVDRLYRRRGYKLKEHLYVGGL